METFSDQDSNFLKFCFIFSVVYLLGYFIVFRKWIKHRFEASSCLMSLAHGTPAVLLASYSILQAQKQSHQLSFSASNNDFQNMVLEYSIAYFVKDLFHYMVFLPSEALFIAHHLATLYVLLTCRYIVRHGAVAVLAVLVLAEVTSPCQNIWSLARMGRGEVPNAGRVYESLSPVFYVFYSVVRMIIAPMLVFKIGVFFVNGEAGDLIPLWAWSSWILVIGSAIFVSVSWILNLWMEWYSRRIKKESEKLN